MSVDNVDYNAAADKADATPDSAAEAGAGGGDMAIWSQDRISKLTALVRGGFTNDNQSAYTLEVGVVDSRIGGYNTPFEDSEPAMETPDAAAEAGAGGGSMDIWAQDRVTILDKLAGGTFENNSQYGMPKGVVNSSTDPYDTSWSANERGLGVAVSGNALDEANEPMSGNVYMEEDDEIVASKSVAGTFLFSSSPPSGVEVGAPSDGIGTYRFRFTPSFAGLDYTKENFGIHHDAGVIKYGAVAGTVTDYDDNPVEGAVVFGSGEGTKTDATGDYKLRAPGGTTVSLNAVGNSKDVTPGAASTVTVNWQFARLVVEVVTPDLEPVAGAPVQIGQESYTTDENGKVVVDPAFVTAYEVIVTEQYADVADIQQEGDLYNLRFGDEGDKAGVDLRVVDEATGAPIRALPGLFPNVESKATSNAEGRLRLFTDDTTEDELVIGTGDSRYRSAVFDGLDLVAGETAEGRIELEPAVQVSNT